MAQEFVGHDLVPSSRPPLAVVGDSITVLSERAIVAAVPGAAAGGGSPKTIASASSSFCAPASAGANTFRKSSWMARLSSATRMRKGSFIHEPLISLAFFSQSTRPDAIIRIGVMAIIEHT